MKRVLFLALFVSLLSFHAFAQFPDAQGGITIPNATTITTNGSTTGSLSVTAAGGLLLKGKGTTTDSCLANAAGTCQLGFRDDTNVMESFTPFYISATGAQNTGDQFGLQQNSAAIRGATFRNLSSTGDIFFYFGNNTSSGFSYLCVAGSAEATNCAAVNSGTMLFGGAALYLKATTNLELLSGSTDLLDYGITTASVVTLPQPTTLSNATVKLTGVTTGTNADVLCLSGTGVVLIQAAASCTISSLRFKPDWKLRFGGYLPQVAALTPGTFHLSGQESNRDPNARTAQLGLNAENVAAVEPRCAVYEPDMRTPKSYRSECVIALLVGAVKELQAEVAELKRGRR